MKRLICLVLILAVILPASSSAFDGNRKGFVLGGGLGFTPVMRISAENPFTGETESD